MVKVSLVLTLRNEEKSIQNLIESLILQTRRPDEIVVVDGGSTDNTVKALQRSKNRHRVPIHIIVEPRANIAKGRNIAIMSASHDYIVSIDGGCIPQKEWLGRILRPLETDISIDVVSGYYEARTESTFERCIGILTYPRVEDLSIDGFLPSGRSIAFKKHCWEEVKGYPEWLETAEDTLFDVMLKNAGFKFHFAPDAIVYWRPREDPISLFIQYYRYSRDTVRAKLSPLLVQAYGEPVLVHIAIAVKDILRRRDLALVLCTPVVLSFIGLGKTLGYFAGLADRLFRDRGSS